MQVAILKAYNLLECEEILYDNPPNIYSLKTQQKIIYGTNGARVLSTLQPRARVTIIEIEQVTTTPPKLFDDPTFLEPLRHYNLLDLQSSTSLPLDILRVIDSNLRDAIQAITMLISIILASLRRLRLYEQDYYVIA